MGDASAPPRYGIYFAPEPDNLWWTMWSDWLGRCAVAGQTRSQPSVDGISDRTFAAITAAPRRYGWHATLKAPMRLVTGVNQEQLIAALRAVCAGHHAFALPPVQVTRLTDFLALTLTQPCEPLDRIAAACVTQLDAMRAPAGVAELAKRRAGVLTTQQEAHLLRWGYPYVLDTFRFHFSLTGSLSQVDPVQIDALHRAAQQRLDQLVDIPLRFDAISIFKEPVPGADFVSIQRIVLP